MTIYTPADICVCCGIPVPEGRMVCPKCNMSVTHNNASKTCVIRAASDKSKKAHGRKTK